MLANRMTSSRSAIPSTTTGASPASALELVRLSGLTGDPEVLIVEGIRHQEAVDVLAEQLPTRKLLLVYLDVSSDQQHQRMAGLGETEGVAGHDVERNVDDLCVIADLVVSTEQPVEKLVTRVRQIVERQAC
jgi:hypothetical protein